MPHKDPEVRKAYIQNYIFKNRVERNAKNKAWREANPDKESARKRRYRKNNPEIMAVLYALRRARKTESKIPLTEDEIKTLRALEKKRKRLCRRYGVSYQLDHILPLAHGGIHHPINIQIITASKNIVKKDKIVPKALTLISEHYRLYTERVGARRANKFKKQLAKVIGIEKVKSFLESHERN